jgi:hypothetical protein
VAIRQGVTDDGMIRTLADLVRRGRGRPEALDAAKKTLEGIRGEIDESLQQVFAAAQDTGAEGGGIGKPAHCFSPPNVLMDRLRKKLFDHIVELTQRR